MSESILGQKIRIKKEIVSMRETRLGTIVLDRNDTYFFQGVEHDIWTRLEGRKIKDVIDELSNLYDADSQMIQSDIMDFIRQMEGAGLIDLI